MADQVAAPPDPAPVTRRHRRTASVPLGATVTFHYRTSGGARGSTTVATSIPVGAVVMGVSTS